MKKRITTLILATTFIFSSSLPAFAVPVDTNVFNSAEVNVVKAKDFTLMVKNTEDQCVVKVDYGDHYEIATRVIGTNSVTVQTFDSNDNMISEKDFTISEPQQAAETRAIGDYQHTWSNYEYDIDTIDSGRHESWECRRENDYKTRTRYEGSSIADRLDLWRDSVDDIDGYEKKVAFYTSATIAKMAIEAYFTAGTASAFTYLAGSAKALSSMTKLIDEMDNADRIFDRL
ncbi:MAG: hypothetical protein EOM28_06120 [Clostridia bacterium]|nr:hypothetical protein [Clostridia bacterium]